MQSIVKNCSGIDVHKMMVMVAIAHKLIRVIYTLLKRRQPYIDPDIDYEGLLVRRNAARWLNKLVDYGYLAQAQQ